MYEKKTVYKNRTHNGHWAIANRITRLYKKKKDFSKNNFS